jgi:hypothetical protein
MEVGQVMMNFHSVAVIKCKIKQYEKEGSMAGAILVVSVGIILSLKSGNAV